VKYETIRFSSGHGVPAINGCASTAKNLQRETARFIGDISPDQVKVMESVHCLGMV
jgi:hypothetical protein